MINANPWLVEMMDVLGSQMLLHVVSLYGETTSERLNNELINAFQCFKPFNATGNVGKLSSEVLLGEKV